MKKIIILIALFLISIVAVEAITCNVDGSASSTGVTCTGKNEDSTDATYDSCTDGTTNGYMFINDMSLDKSVATTDDSVQVTCNVCCYSASTTKYNIFYSSGSGWKNVAFGSCVGGSSSPTCTVIESKTVNVPLDDVAGTHYFRCQEYNSGCDTTTSCCTSVYADNDDMSVTVTGSSLGTQTQIITDPLKNPYGKVFTIPEEIGISYSSLKSCLGIDSCYQQENYESGSCSYLFFCYSVLPWDSTSIGDAILKECVDITDSEKTLEIKDFVPPRGILYYISNYIVKIDYTYNDATNDWNDPIPTIPPSCDGTQLIHATDVRAVCPEGQLLGIQRDANGVINEGSFGCYPAKRMCLDTMSTGLCTNSYDLYVLDLDGDGDFAEHYNQAGAYCEDSQPRDGVCDTTVSFSCPDICKQYSYDSDGIMYCSISGSDGVCDIWNMGVTAHCEDDVLSPHSGICDDIDTGICNTEFIPVCVAATNGETVGGQTFPNKCYAEAKGYNECPTSTPTTGCYIGGQCVTVDPQCFQDFDCQDLNVCGSGQVLSKLCINYQCQYSGSCSSSQCQTDEDCSYLEDICVGISATCNTDASVCSVSGSCIQAPISSEFNIWALIQSIFTALFNFIKSLFA